MGLPELLAPAGNLERLRTCLLYGANAVYLGGRSGNLRASCEGFTSKELVQGVSEARKAGARLYYCLNSFPLERELVALPGAIEAAALAGIHAFIVADPGVIALARRHAPGIPVHLSTQANTTNSAAVSFWADQGVERINLARELNCRELYAIRRASPHMELEVFVHGAMCLALSGQCLLSAWLNNRPANQGRCTQPCRFDYRAMDLERSGEALDGLFEKTLTVEEYTRPGEALWRVEQGERHASFWAPDELCLLPWLPWFVRTGIQALKIEGRMRSPAYLAQVVDAYRHALDRLGGTGFEKGNAGVGDGFAGPENMYAGGGHTHSCFMGGERADADRPPGFGKAGGMTDVLRDPCMMELFYAAFRPLSSGFFLPGRRRNFSGEALSRSGLVPTACRSGETGIPDFGHGILAQVIEPAGRAAWRIEVRGNWRRDQDVECVLPGLRRPVLIGGSYGLENQRKELANELGSGVRGLLYADADGVVPGIFIRAAQ